MNSRMSLKFSLTPLALALLLPLAANAASASADANSLACKLRASDVDITNNGTATIPEGTRIVVRLYPAPGSGGSMTQKVLYLKSALTPGVTTSLTNESPGFYHDCIARAAS